VNESLTEERAVRELDLAGGRVALVSIEDDEVVLSVVGRDDSLSAAFGRQDGRRVAMALIEGSQHLWERQGDGDAGA